MYILLTKAVGYFFDLLRSLLAGIVGRVLATLGIGFASYTALLPSLVAFVQEFIFALPPDQQALLGALNVDVALTMVFSAMAVKLGTRVMPIRVGGTNAP